MKEEVDFVTPTIQTIKHSLKEIAESYSNYWDILAELIQNSVDAIYKRDINKGKINIKIDSKKKEITIYDNGIGIESNKLGKLLTPFESNKRDEYITSGEKGVGLDYAIFDSNYFKIKTSYNSNGIVTIGVVQHARSWRDSDDDKNIYLQQTISEANFEGTEIVIRELSYDKIFDYNIDSLIFLIRTKTAAGNISQIIGKECKNISIQLTHVDKSGKMQTKNIKNSYWSPIEGLNSDCIVDYKEYLEKFKNYEEDSEFRKREFLKDKIVYYSGEKSKSDGTIIQFWSCYVPNRDIWQQLSVKNHLIEKNAEITEDTLCFQSGITISLKNRPTSIYLPQPQRLGNAGYFPNFFIIINDDSLVLDIGRKSIPENDKNEYVPLIKEIFNIYAIKIAPFFKEEIDEKGKTFQETMDRIKSLPKLKSNILKFSHIPTEQEASVAAIFFELVGTKKCFIDYRPHYTEYKNKYDLYGSYKKTVVVSEFKSKLKNIVKDYKNLKKMADEINYLICWNVTDEDVIELKNKTNSEVIPINHSALKLKKKYMPEVTHKLQYSEVANPIYIIDLKVVTENLNKNERYYIELNDEYE